MMREEEAAIEARVLGLLREACAETRLEAGATTPLSLVVATDKAIVVLKRQDDERASVEVAREPAGEGLAVRAGWTTVARLADRSLAPAMALARGDVKILRGTRADASWALPLLRALVRRETTPHEEVALEARFVEVRQAGPKLAYAMRLTATVGLGEERRSWSWTVAKRYSEFRALRDTLRRRRSSSLAVDDDDDDIDDDVRSDVSFSSVATSKKKEPAFPSRTSASISGRARGLEAWLQHQLASEQHSAALYAFLQVDAERSRALGAVRAAERALRTPLRPPKRTPEDHDEEEAAAESAPPPVLPRKEDDETVLLLLLVLLQTTTGALLVAGAATTGRGWLSVPGLAVLRVAVFSLAGGDAAYFAKFVFAVCLLATLATSARRLASVAWLLVQVVLLERTGVLRGLRIYVTACLVIGTYVVAKVGATAIFRLPEGSAARERYFDRIHRVVAPLMAREFAALTSIWVKVGQYISSRADVVPGTWHAALKKLQDALPADSPPSVRQTLAEAGLSSLEVRHPAIASASVAQVHVGYVSGENVRESDSKKKVAVKVQHRGVAALFRADVRRAVTIARWCARLDSSFEATVTILESWQREIHKELDFRVEVEHLRKARHLLKDVPGVVVPEPHPFGGGDHEMAFAMSFVENAFKMDDARKLRQFHVDRRALCLRFAHVLCRLVFDSGFVHCDCHLGNVLVLPPDPASSLLRMAWLDWGWAHALNETELGAWRDLSIGLHDLDTEACIEALRRLGYENSQDAVSPERSVEFFNFLFRGTSSAADAKAETDAFFQKRKDQKRAGGGSRKITKVPESFFFVVRVFGNLRGICATLGVKLPLPDIMALHARAGKARDLLRRCTDEASS